MRTNTQSALASDSHPKQTALQSGYNFAITNTEAVGCSFIVGAANNIAATQLANQMYRDGAAADRLQPSPDDQVFSSNSAVFARHASSLGWSGDRVTVFLSVRRRRSCCIDFGALSNQASTFAIFLKFLIGRAGTRGASGLESVLEISNTQYRWSFSSPNSISKLPRSRS